MIALLLLVTLGKIDPPFQARIEAIDAQVRAKYAIPGEQTDVGVLDLEHHRLALIHPDQEEYAASVAKVGILLAWFQLHSEPPDPQTRHELGLMVKISSNEMATKFSRQMGISEVQRIIDDYGLYDPDHGGGIWFGKHYGPGGERAFDIYGNVHGATVRQLLHFWLLLDEGNLVSPRASQTMKEIFDSPDIPPDMIKFRKGLEGRDVQILSKTGSYGNWLHDSALITGPGRHYILVGLTTNPCGDAYLEDLARAVDDLMGAGASH